MATVRKFQPGSSLKAWFKQLKTGVYILQAMYRMLKSSWKLKKVESSVRKAQPALEFLLSFSNYLLKALTFWSLVPRQKQMNKQTVMPPGDRDVSYCWMLGCSPHQFSSEHKV